MATIRTLGGGAKSETMPDSNSAHEPPYCEGPLHEMSLREIAEAFVKDPDADVVGVIHKLLLLKQASPSFRDQDAYNLAFDVIEFVEAQNEG